MVRMFDGSIKQIRDLKVEDQLLGEDNQARRISQISISPKPIPTYVIVLPVVPDGNRLLNQDIHTDASKSYVVPFMEPIVDSSNQITGADLKKKVFPSPEEALLFVEKSLPNFLYEPTLQQYMKMSSASQAYFTLVRPLLPVRFSVQQTELSAKCKGLFERQKEAGLKSMDLPWTLGLFLAAGQHMDGKLVYNLKELHKNVNVELRRVLEQVKGSVEFVEDTQVLTATMPGSNLVYDFFAAFAVYNPSSGQFQKNNLARNLRLESFSRIRGPLLAGLMDGAAEYGLADTNYGLECYIRGLSDPLKEEVADLARSCALAVFETDCLTLAGGMLFRVPCVNNPPKDIPGFVCLTGYPNDEGTNVLLGMQQQFSVEKGEDHECVAVSVEGRFLLADYTVVGVQ